MDIVIGRKEEKKILQKLYQSTKAEFLAVYGRRRIGKTFLIRQFFKDRGVYLEIIGNKDSPKKEQLLYFYREFCALFKSENKNTPPKSWAEAFTILQREIEKIPLSQKIILFFDEIPWLSGGKSGFLPALEYFWNRHASQMDNVLVIVCGSAASWMIKKVIYNKGGLHGRLSAEIRLTPFSLQEVEAFFVQHHIELTRKQIVEVYMVTGGVPKYLSYVERGQSSMQIAHSLCFTPQAPLLTEFHKLYSSLFQDSYRHVKVISSLCSTRQGMTAKELSQAAKIPVGGRSHEILEELEASGFVASLSTYGKQSKEKKFRLIDEYSLFYLTWIDSVKESILWGEKEHWFKIQRSPAWYAWAGYAFETVCLKHIYKIKEALSIGGVSTKISYWRYISSKDCEETGAEIDLVIDRADDCIHLCEMKFCEKEFVMTREEAKQLEHKKQVFIEKTKTKKAIFITLITPYGAVENMHYLSCVHNQLSVDCLF